MDEGVARLVNVLASFKEEQLEEAGRVFEEIFRNARERGLRPQPMNVPMGPVRGVCPYCGR
jgi:hypothetical protein